MEFRPCIDIHNGKVKQIVGQSLKDQGNVASENFVSAKGADYYAKLYEKANLKGGHIILLNSKDSDYYEATKQQALLALRAYPGGLQVGGGITPDNANEFLEAGASHVIITSYVFKDGRIYYDRLDKLKEVVGKNRLVLDVSCKRVGDDYFVVTDRWQNMTEEKLDEELLDRLSEYCDEFLVHAVDVEGKNSGIEEVLAKRLGNWKKLPITYAGGVHEYEDLETLYAYGEGNLNVTIGSALDLFGGKLSFDEIVKKCHKLSGEKEIG